MVAEDWINCKNADLIHYSLKDISNTPKWLVIKVAPGDLFNFPEDGEGTGSYVVQSALVFHIN